MKKFLMMIALFGVPAALLTGCGGSGEPETVGGVEIEEDSSMPVDMRAQYEADMKGGGSSKPGN